MFGSTIDDDLAAIRGGGDDQQEPPQQRPSSSIEDDLAAIRQGAGRSPALAEHAAPLTGEQAFRSWYSGVSNRYSLDANPDDPRHFYDWRAAYKAGATPVLNEDDNRMHWPSEFKTLGHPNLVVDGTDTRTGLPPSSLTKAAQLTAGFPQPGEAESIGAYLKQQGVKPAPPPIPGAPARATGLMPPPRPIAADAATAVEYHPGPYEEDVPTGISYRNVNNKTGEEGPTQQVTRHVIHGADARPGITDYLLNAGNTFAQTMGDDAGKIASHMTVLADQLRSIASANVDLPEGQRPEKIADNVPVQQRTGYQAGQAIRRTAAQLFPEDARLQDSFIAHTIPATLASLSTFMGAEALGGPVAGGAVMAAEGSGGELEAAIKKGADDRTALRAGRLGELPGLAYPLAGAAGKAILGAAETAGGAAAAMRAGARGAVEMAGAGAVDQLGHNVVAQQTYDPERKTLEGVPSSMASNAAAAFILSSLLHGRGGRITMDENGNLGWQSAPKNTPPPDPYGILNVHPDATDAEVNAAYRRAVKDLSPQNRPNDAGVQTQFQNLNVARDAIFRQRAGGPDAEPPVGSGENPRPYNHPNPDYTVEGPAGLLQRPAVDRLGTPIGQVPTGPTGFSVHEERALAETKRRVQSLQLTGQHVDPDAVAQMYQQLLTASQEAVTKVAAPEGLPPRAEGATPLPRTGSIDQDLADIRKNAPTAQRPNDVFEVSPHELAIRPDVYQYKEANPQTGETGALQGVKKWNPDLGGVVQVYREPDGTLAVVNGHQRVNLAKRLNAPTVLARQIQASSPENARMIGALTNIAEGSGTAVDAAKVLRESGMDRDALDNAGVPRASKVGRDGLALAQLHPGLFDQVARGKLPVERAVIYGRSGLATEQQLALSQLVQAREGGRKTALTNAQIEELARFAKDSGSQQVTQDTLFGSDTETQSNAIEEAKQSAWLIDRLGKQARTFKFVSKGERAGELGAAGVGTIDTEKAGQLGTEASQVLEVYRKLSSRGGDVREALKNAAAAIKGGQDEHAVRTQLLTTVKASVQAALRGGPEGGTDRGSAAEPPTRDGAEPSPLAQAEPGEVAKPDEHVSGANVYRPVDMTNRQNEAIERLAKLYLRELEIADQYGKIPNQTQAVQERKAERARSEERGKLEHLFPNLSTIELTAAFRTRAHELYREKHGTPSRDEGHMAREEGWERFAPEKGRDPIGQMLATGTNPVNGKELTDEQLTELLKIRRGESKLTWRQVIAGKRAPAAEPPPVAAPPAATPTAEGEAPRAPRQMGEDAYNDMAAGYGGSKFTTPGTRVSWDNLAAWVEGRAELDRRRSSSTKYAQEDAHIEELAAHPDVIKYENDPAVLEAAREIIKKHGDQFTSFGAKGPGKNDTPGTRVLNYINNRLDALEQRSGPLASSKPHDLFGNREAEAVGQGELGITKPQGITAALEEARATVSRLQGKVDRGAVTVGELRRYQEANGLIRRQEGAGLGEGEVKPAPASKPEGEEPLGLFGDRPAPGGSATAERPRAKGSFGSATAEGAWEQKPATLDDGTELHPIAPVEALKILKEAMGGKFEVVVKRLPGMRGYFMPQPGEERIGLNAELGKNYDQFAKTFLHEIGHAIDYLDVGTMARGNILGRIAALRNYMLQTIDALPTKPSQAITEAERKQIRKDAEKAIGKRPHGGSALQAWKNSIADEFERRIQDEIGRRGLIDRDAVTDELKDLSDWWRGPFGMEGTNYHRYRSSSVELYADALSAFLNSPGSLQERAPTFFNAFMAYMDAKPKVKAAYDDVQKLMGNSADLTASREKQLEEGFGQGEESIREAERKPRYTQSFPGYIKQLLVLRAAPVVDLEGKRIGGEKLSTDTARTVKLTLEEHAHADNANAMLMDSMDTRVIQPLLKAGWGNTEEAGGDVGKYLALTRISEGDRGGIAEKAKDAIRDATGETDWIEASRAYTKLIVEKDPDADPELLELAETGLLNPYGHTPKTAQETLDGMRDRMGEKKWGALVQAAEQFRNVQYVVSKAAIRAGVYSSDFADTLEKGKDAYATYLVNDYFNGKVSGQVRRQIGTVKGIADPFTGGVLKMMAINRAIARQTAVKAVVHTVLADIPGEVGEEKFVNKYRRESRPGAGRENLFYYKDGKTYYREVPEYVAAVLNQRDLGVIQRLAESAGSRLYRIFHPLWVGLNVGWQVTNPPRDFKRTYTQAMAEARAAAGQTGMGKILNPPMDFFWNLPRAYFAGTLNGSGAIPQAWKYARNAEMSPTIRKMLNDRAFGQLFARQTPDGLTEGEKTELEQLRQLPRPTNRQGKRLAKLESRLDDSTKYDRMVEQFLPGRVKRKGALTKVGGFIHDLGAFQEVLGKVAAYNAVSSVRGPLAPEGLGDRQRAAIVRNLAATPDSRQRGAGADATNALLSYYNVNMAGLRSGANVAVHPKTRGDYAVRALTSDFFLKGMMAAAAAGVFGAFLKEFYRRIPEYDKEKYIVVPMGWVTEKDGTWKPRYLRVPHDDFIRPIAAATWAATHARTLAEKVQAPFQVFGGEVPGLTPLVDIPIKWGQFLTGTNPKDSYHGRDVVPKTEWDAGGWYRWKEMLRYTLADFGVAGQALGFFTNAPPVGEERSLEETLEQSIPGVSRLIKTSDTGLREEENAAVAKTDQLRAEARAQMTEQDRGMVSERDRLNRMKSAGVKMSDAEQERRTELNRWFTNVYSPKLKAQQDSLGIEPRVPAPRGGPSLPKLPAPPKLPRP